MAPERSTCTCAGCGRSWAPEYEALIGTVRNVGYKAVRPARGRSGSSDGEHSGADFEAADDVDPVSASMPGQ